MAWAKRLACGLFGLMLLAGLVISQEPGKQKDPPKPADEHDTKAEDEKAVRDVGLTPDGPGMLDYFRKRTLKNIDPKTVEALVKQLGDDEFDVREQAFTALATIGTAAADVLKKAEQDKDTEVRKRVHDLRQRLDAKAEPVVQSAAARIVARTKPAGAADVLMAYLPFSPDPAVTDEICKALGAVAVQGGKVEPVLTKALEDATPLKRGAAGEALARGAADQLPAVRELLKDKDARVRLRVAMALVPRKEKEVIPVLIDLLASLNADELGGAEEVLYRLAGDKAPNVNLGSDETSRKKAQKEWHDWYEKNKAGIDVAKMVEAEPMLGYTVICTVQALNRFVGGKQLPPGEVKEIRADKKERWKFNLATHPVDAQVLAENRVLVAELQGGRVTERDFKGNIIWEQSVNGNPTGVQGLPNGNVFVTMQNRLAEYDRKGNELFKYERPQHDIMRARKLRSGEVVFVTNNGNNATVTRMDANKKVVKTFTARPIFSPYGGMDILPGGGVLLPDQQQSKVHEYDGDGRVVRSISVMSPISAQRLPNGNTLVVNQNQRQVVEFNRSGQQVWNMDCNGMPQPNLPPGFQQVNVFSARRR